MELQDAYRLARTLMDAHGVGHWSFYFDRAKKRKGLCHYEKEALSLSKHLTLQGDESFVRNTTLHLVAHALGGPPTVHSPRWEQIARALGCDDGAVVEGRYEISCKTCGWAGYLGRLDRTKTMWCHACSTQVEIRKR